MSLSLIMTGGGKLSVDEMMHKKGEEAANRNNFLRVTLRCGMCMRPE